MEEQEDNTLARCCIVLRFLKTLLTSDLRTIAAANLHSQKWIFAANGFETPVNRFKFAANSNLASLSSITLCKSLGLAARNFVSLASFL